MPCYRGIGEYRAARGGGPAAAPIITGSARSYTTVGGKVLKYKLRAEHAGHYRDVAEPF
jgi:hypothetical protein